VEELIDIIENISAMSELIAIIAVAPTYEAGELSPQSLKRAAFIINMLCEQATAKIEQFTEDKAETSP